MKTYSHSPFAERALTFGLLTAIFGAANALLPATFSRARADGISAKTPEQFPDERFSDERFSDDLPGKIESIERDFDGYLARKSLPARAIPRLQKSQIVATARLRVGAVTIPVFHVRDSAATRAGDGEKRDALFVPARRFFELAAGQGITRPVVLHWDESWRAIFVNGQYQHDAALLGSVGLLELDAILRVADSRTLGNLAVVD